MKDCSCSYISGGAIEGTEFWLNDLWKFEAGDKNLLLERQGHILLLKKNLCNTIWNQSCCSMFPGKSSTPLPR